MKRLMILVVAASLACTAALADPPAGKGKDKDKGAPTIEQPVYRPTDGSKDRPPGQVTSGCNHQANDLGIKGQQRKEFVERCQRRGGDKWSSADYGRHCRERAEQRGLRGDEKDRFIRRCRDYRDDDAAPKLYGKEGKKGEPAFNPRDPDGSRGKDDR